MLSTKFTFWSTSRFNIKEQMRFSCSDPNALPTSITFHNILLPCLSDPFSLWVFIRWNWLIKNLSIFWSIWNTLKYSSWLDWRRWRCLKHGLEKSVTHLFLFWTWNLQMDNRCPKSPLCRLPFSRSFYLTNSTHLALRVISFLISNVWEMSLKTWCWELLLLLLWLKSL